MWHSAMQVGAWIVSEIDGTYRPAHGDMAGPGEVIIRCTAWEISAQYSPAESYRLSAAYNTFVGDHGLVYPRLK
jgi:hypothetical protein